MGLPRRGASLIQAAGFGADALDVGAVAERRPLPQVEGGGEEACGVVGAGLACGVDERLEAFGVELTGGDVEGEAAAAARQRGAELGRGAATRRSAASRRRWPAGRRPTAHRRGRRSSTTSPRAASRTASTVRWLGLPTGRPGRGRRPARRHPSTRKRMAQRYDASRLRSLRCRAIQRAIALRCARRHGRCHGHRRAAHDRMGAATSPSATRCCAATCSTTPRSMPRSRSPAAGGRSMPTTSRWPISVDRAATSTARSCSPRRPTGTTLLARIERFFRCGRGQACLWSAWPTPDLRGHGWRLSGHPPLLVRPPLSTTPIAHRPTPDLEVRPVASAADLAALGARRHRRLPAAGAAAMPRPVRFARRAPRRRAAAVLRRPGRRPPGRRRRFVHVPRHRLARLRRHAAGGPAARASGAGSPSNASGPRPTCG